jgi:hypothetical protein
VPLKGMVSDGLMSWFDIVSAILGGVAGGFIVVCLATFLMSSLNRGLST